MKKLIKYFLQGLLIFAPIALTVFAIIWVVSLIDQYLTIKISEDFSIRGGGFVLILILLPVLGFLASNYFGQKLVQLIDKLFTKLPLIKLLYNSLKDMINAFAGDQKSFDKPVLVNITGSDEGAKLIGFVTRDSLDFLNIKDHVAVYFPQSYNFAGNVLVFPSKNITPIDADSADVMTFIVSAGVSGPRG